MSDQSHLETPSIWMIAVSPVILLLTLFGPNGLLGRSPSDAAGVLRGDLDGTDLLRNGIDAVVWGSGLVLAYLDSDRLKSEGFVRPFGWLWALLGGGVYLIGRCIVVNRRTGGALRPMWVWIALAALYIVLALAWLL